jgi:uncharacterized damage-inducible protein DinB
MRTLLRALLLCLLVPTAIALSQDKPPAVAVPAASPADPLSTFNKMVYEGVKGILLRSAEKMPEENYAFRPTDAVRTYGQIIGHVADSQYYFCSLALGETNPAPQIEKTKTSKADLITALKGAFSYCDKAYSSMTDATAIQPVTLFGGPTPKIGVLEVNLMHSMEHYGNLVTYMRMKNIIPPTSEPGAMPKP